MAEEHSHTNEVLSGIKKVLQKVLQKKEEEEPKRNTEVLSEILELLQKKDKGEPNDFVVHYPYPRQREDPVKVFVRISIVRIGEIDTVRQEFQCEFYMRLCWTEGKLKNTGKDEKEQTSWESQWDPRQYFKNAVKVDEHDIKKKLAGDAEVVHHCYIKGIFKKVLELSDFPFH